MAAVFALSSSDVAASNAAAASAAALARASRLNQRVMLTIELKAPSLASRRRESYVLASHASQPPPEDSVRSRLMARCVSAGGGGMEGGRIS